MEEHGRGARGEGPGGRTPDQAFRIAQLRATNDLSGRGCVPGFVEKKTGMVHKVLWRIAMRCSASVCYDVLR